MTLRDYFRMAGVIFTLLGLMGLPVGYGANPKRDLSLFSNFADLGFFLPISLTLIPVGVLIFAASYVPVGRKRKTMRGRSRGTGLR